MDDEERRIPLIKDDGTVFWALPREVDELIKPGREAGEMQLWPGPSLPKEQYYPQYDKRGGAANAKSFKSLGPESGILAVDVV